MKKQIKPENVIRVVDYTCKDLLIDDMEEYAQQKIKTKIIKTKDGNWALFSVEK